MGVDHILQTAEHLVGDLFHLAQPLMVDKVLDLSLIHISEPTSPY